MPDSRRHGGSGPTERAGAAQAGTAAAVRGRRIDESREQKPAVGRSEERVDGVLRVRHEPHDVARLVDDARDVAERAVHVVR